MAQRISGAKIARLMYLMKTNPSLKIPPKLVKLVPGGSWLSAMSEDGPGAAGVDLNLVDKLLEQGAKLGDGDVKEGVVILQQLVDETVRDNMTFSIDRKLQIYRLLDNLSAGAIEDTEIIDMSDPGEIQHLQKFDTGFAPLDVVTGGLYQAIVMVMGQPGSGKTSHLISIMEEMRKSNLSNEILYVENEIPTNMMKGRLYDVFKRTTFSPNDKLICGPWNVDNILEYIKDNPNPDRIVLFDSPDVMTASGSNDGKRFYLENQFLKLIEVKRRSKIVIVSSWPNRAAGNLIESQLDVSECVGKAWYSDLILGIGLLGHSTVQYRVLKNRFGQNLRELTFNYDYVDLTWDSDSITEEEEFWGAIVDEKPQIEAESSEPSINTANGNSNGLTII